jgi:hypothetical protein
MQPHHFPVLASPTFGVPLAASMPHPSPSASGIPSSSIGGTPPHSGVSFNSDTVVAFYETRSKHDLQETQAEYSALNEFADRDR